MDQIIITILASLVTTGSLGAVAFYAFKSKVREIAREEVAKHEKKCSIPTLIANLIHRLDELQKDVRELRVDVRELRK